MTPIMKCGHGANATSSRTGKPCCAICIGIDPGAEVIDNNPPPLAGRFALCSYTHRRDDSLCKSVKPSSPDLAFFEAKPDEPYDRFYCGCWGWE